MTSALLARPIQSRDFGFEFLRRQRIDPGDAAEHGRHPPNRQRQHHEAKPTTSGALILPLVQTLLQ